jgi:hypothetical protein
VPEAESDQSSLCQIHKGEKKSVKKKKQVYSMPKVESVRSSLCEIRRGKKKKSQRKKEKSPRRAGG